ncbi:MAG: hypothetical protein RIM72_02885 [Alphaproteobacteria bacterium]
MLTYACCLYQKLHPFVFNLFPKKPDHFAREFSIYMSLPRKLELAAMKLVGHLDRQEYGHRLNNRTENSHQPFRRREDAMLKFREVKTLQKFRSVGASIHKHFCFDRHFISRDTFKQNHSTALVELW